MVKDLADDTRIFDGADDFGFAAAGITNLNIDVEDAFQKSRPTDPRFGCGFLAYLGHS